MAFDLTPMQQFLTGSRQAANPYAGQTFAQFYQPIQQMQAGEANNVMNADKIGGIADETGYKNALSGYLTGQLGAGQDITRPGVAAAIAPYAPKDATNMLFDHQGAGKGTTGNRLLDEADRQAAAKLQGQMETLAATIIQKYKAKQDYSSELAQYGALNTQQYQYTGKMYESPQFKQNNIMFGQQNQTNQMATQINREMIKMGDTQVEEATKDIQAMKPTIDKIGVALRTAAKDGKMNNIAAIGGAKMIAKSWDNSVVMPSEMVQAFPNGIDVNGNRIDVSKGIQGILDMPLVSALINQVTQGVKMSSKNMRDLWSIYQAIAGYYSASLKVLTDKIVGGVKNSYATQVAGTNLDNVNIAPFEQHIKDKMDVYAMNDVGAEPDWKMFDVNSPGNGGAATGGAKNRDFTFGGKPIKADWDGATFQLIYNGENYTASATKSGVPLAFDTPANDIAFKKDQ